MIVDVEEARMRIHQKFPGPALFMNLAMGVMVASCSAAKPRPGCFEVVGKAIDDRVSPNTRFQSPNPTPTPKSQRFAR